MEHKAPPVWAITAAVLVGAALVLALATTSSTSRNAPFKRQPLGEQQLVGVPLHIPGYDSPLTPLMEAPQANGVWRYKALPFSTQEYGTDRLVSSFRARSLPQWL